MSYYEAEWGLLPLPAFPVRQEERQAVKTPTHTPLCDAAVEEVNGLGGWFYAVPVETAKSLERGQRFYRILLEQIANGKRNTIERRLAKSGILFWDQLQAEKKKGRK